MSSLGASTEQPCTARNLRPLAGLLAAMAVSLSGTRISAIALPWFVLVTTGSAVQTGLVAFCEMVPYVIVKALTGPLTDRVGPRLVSWTTDAVSAVAAALVPLLNVADALSFPALLMLVAVIGAARGPGDLAKEIMVPEAADHARIPLERATGMSGVTERLASTAGPAIGGALLALVGPVAGLALNAASFALGSLIIGVTLPRGVGLADPSVERGSGYWRRLGEGCTFLRGDPLLLTVIVMVAVTNLLDAAFTSVLLPVWAKESGQGPAAIGLAGSAMGAAAVAGSLIAAAVAHRLRRRPVFFVGFLLAGAPRFFVLASEAPLWAVVTVFAVAGLGAGFINPIIGTVFFERIPRRLLGRVGALGDATAWTGIPLGGLLAGAAVTSFGLLPVLIAGGTAYVLAIGLAGLRREWREMDRPRGGESAKPVGDGLPSPPREQTPVSPRSPAGP